MKKLATSFVFLIFLGVLIAAIVIIPTTMLFIGFILIGSVVSFSAASCGVFGIFLLYVLSLFLVTSFFIHILHLRKGGGLIYCIALILLLYPFGWLLERLYHLFS